MLIPNFTCSCHINLRISQFSYIVLNCHFYNSSLHLKFLPFYPSVFESDPGYHSKPMSQGYAIQLYFDPALENQVLKAWNMLARNQISTKLTEIESRPHITLFSTPLIDPIKLGNIMKSIVSKQEPIPISLSSIGTLSNDQDIIFLSPTPTLALLRFHSQLCDAMEKEGIEIEGEYKPDFWVPHCLVAKEVPKVQLVDGFSLLRELEFQVDGHGVDIAVVESSPVREWFSFVLGNSVDF